MVNITNSPLVSFLNQALAQTIDLKLQAKQAHWNVKGANFIALHELFDALATEVETYADMLAERVVQLDGIAAGTLQAVASGSTLKPYPVDAQKNTLHVEALSAAIKACADTAREMIDKSTELGDAVSADLFTEVARGLDKQYWFVSAHNAS